MFPVEKNMYKNLKLRWKKEKDSCRDKLLRNTISRKAG